MMIAPTLLALAVLASSIAIAGADISHGLGVNYGQLGNDLPPPWRSVELIKSLNAKRVKIYDANPEILKALVNKTDLQVSIMVPNDQIPRIAKAQTFSDNWVEKNVVPFYPLVKIRYLLVGNEILTNPDVDTWHTLVPAMQRIHASIRSFKLHKIKVSTPSAMNVLESSFPPSNGTFRVDISSDIIKPMLDFLNRTGSYFFIDVYTYFAWADNPVDIKLDYALLQPNSKTTYTDPVTNLTYTNLFDQMIDAVVFAMKRLGHDDIPLFLAETGWPNGGDLDQIGANISNAATFVRNVVRKLSAKPVIGSPARPHSGLPSFIFALYNENQKPGPGTERHFGLLYPNGTKVFDIDLSGKTTDY